MLRFWQMFGNALVALGLLAFATQPIIGVIVAGSSLFVLTPASSLIIAVLGVLIRIDCAIRAV